MGGRLACIILITVVTSELCEIANEVVGREISLGLCYFFPCISNDCVALWRRWKFDGVAVFVSTHAAYFPHRSRLGRLPVSRLPSWAVLCRRGKEHRLKPCWITEQITHRHAQTYKHVCPTRWKIWIATHMKHKWNDSGGQDEIALYGSAVLQRVLRQQWWTKCQRDRFKTSTQMFFCFVENTLPATKGKQIPLLPACVQCTAVSLKH